MDQAAPVMLNRLLVRLDQTVLGPNPSEHHTPSQYERQKIASNIEHARTLLLSLEKQSSSIRNPSQKQQTQTDLQRKRELIKKLNTRLQEWDQAAAAAARAQESDDDSEGSDSIKDDDDQEIGESAARNTPSYAPARADAHDGLDTNSAPQTVLAPGTRQELRSRRPIDPGNSDSTRATTTAREQLFAGRPQTVSEPQSLSQREALLSHNRTEQESLTNGLLGLAQALKQSSQQFSKSLSDEKDVLKRAEGGLDKSALGMEAAERKMGTLRRMSEGQGWWGRMKLYAFIFALWVGCFLVVFVGPKLRL